MGRVAILDDYQNVALKSADWSGLGDITVFDDHVADPDALVERLKDFEIVCLMRERTPFSKALIDRLPKLKLLVTTGMRNASVDVAAAHARGVVVSGTGGVGHPTAELTWGLILSLMRAIPFEAEAMRRGGWQTTIGRSLKGSRLGLLGLGNLGRQVARVGIAFNMDVVAWSQNLTAQRAAEVGARLVSKEELMRDSDIVSIHLVLSARSRGLVGAADLALMKSTAFLVNTSRGPIVDESALVDALETRRIGGAGLDVYEVEPLPANHRLRSLSNVVLTPHLGYVTDDTYAVFYRETAECVRGFLAGTPVRVIAP